jgi:glutaredoxin
MTKPIVELYARKDCSLCNMPGCTLCKEAVDVIGRVSGEMAFTCKEVDIDASEDLARRFKGEIPTIFLNGKKVFKYKVEEAEFKKKVRNEIIKAGISRLRNKRFS